jgi:single-stranded-DNA-specific exonuclease
LNAIRKVAGLEEGPVTAREVAFRIVPLVNAAGRMDHAMEAFRLLTESDEGKAEGLALYLKSLNESRQKVQLRIQKCASEMVDRLGDMPAYVLYHDDWNMGVVGIAASKLSEATGRPVLLLAPDGEKMCGSGRCPECYDLVDLLDRSSMYLSRFGGHKSAAGLALNASDFDAFREKFMEVCRQAMVDRGKPVLKIDAVVSIKEMSDPAYIDFLDSLEPFGPGYSAPLFSVRDFTLLGSSVVGNNHLKLRIGHPEGMGGVFDILGWSHGNRLDIPWNSCEIAFEPSINTWNGSRKIQFILRDARKRD